MATEKKNTADATAVVRDSAKADVMVEPTVRVFLPLKEDANSDLAIDQTETVTINGVNTRIKRGEYVDVKVPVFMQLKQRFPSI